MTRRYAVREDGATIGYVQRCADGSPDCGHALDVTGRVVGRDASRGLAMSMLRRWFYAPLLGAIR